MSLMPEFIARRFEERKKKQCEATWVWVIMSKYADVPDKDRDVSVGVTINNVCQGKHGPFQPRWKKVEEGVRTHPNFPLGRAFTLDLSRGDGIYARGDFARTPLLVAAAAKPDNN